MRSYLASLGVAGVVSVCLVSGSALANSSGISGRSGKDGASVTCAECHSGGATPTVTIEGPNTLAPGATGNYTFIVRGGPARGAGFNVAVSDEKATLNAVSGSGARKLSGELTHTTIRSFTNGEARFDFTLVAPADPGRITLYGAGNSVNDNGTDEGDASATTTLDINVGGDGGAKDEGGCAAAGGVPLLGAALVLLGTRLRRRR